MEFIKWGQKQVRQFALNLTETEVLVEEATNSEPWGPHGSDMSKIADEAIDPEKYREIMTVIARRLTDSGENWRHVYKALLLLEHLVRHGPAKVARDTQANSNVLLDLQSFEFKDKNGRDQGINVRNRSKELLALVMDPERLTEAREAARANRNKYRGTAKDSIRFMSDSPPAMSSQTLPKRVVYEEKKEEEVAEDPFEATRKRIEKLKASDKDTPAPLKVQLPQQGKREPKKLSQVKMNPEIAAAFLKSASAHTSIPQTVTPVQPADDLLGDLTDVAPAMTVSAEPVPNLDNEEGKQGVGDMFDALAAPAAPAAPAPEQAAQQDDWADFNAAQPTEAVPKEIPLTDLLPQESGRPTAMISAPMAAPVAIAAAPSRADPFASLCVTQQKPAQVPMGAGRTAGSTPPPPVPNGYTTAPWTAQTVPQQMGMKPEIDFQMPYPLGTSHVRPQGTPTPAAIPAQRAAMPNKDPFANLGF